MTRGSGRRFAGNDRETVVAGSNRQGHDATTLRRALHPHARMEMRIDAPRRLPADPRRRLQVGQPRHLHPARRAEMVQQRPLARRADARRSRPARSHQIAFDRPARCVVMAKRCASSRRRCRKYSTGSRGGSWNGVRAVGVEPLAAGVAVRPLGDRHQLARPARPGRSARRAPPKAARRRRRSAPGRATRPPARPPPVPSARGRSGAAAPRASWRSRRPGRSARGCRISGRPPSRTPPARRRSSRRTALVPMMWLLS